MARDIVEAYLRGQAGELFEGRPDDAAARVQATRAAVRPLAPEIHAALVAQNARLAPSRARELNLAALRQGAAAVVTGQQVGLFLGPLYTLYKAASAIQVARALAAAAGVPVVPIFWLQTEDHDLPEIASCGLAGAGGEPASVALPASAQDRTSIAHRVLPDGVDGCLAELREQLGGLAHAEAHLARLARHYRAGAGWAQAFAGLLAELFADEGLVFVDPRDPALAPAARPVHERALADAGPIAALLAERASLLGERGFAAPVHVRAGAPLCFFHPDGPTGPRFRLEPDPADGDRFLEVGGTRAHTRAELRAALAAEPLRFSTSALLRPILQDTWLPTVAYVGGPGELAYFAQLRPLYAHFGLRMPLVLLRARFRLVEARTRRLLDRLGLQPADAARGEDELLARLRRDDPAWPAAADLERRLLAPFEAALAELAAAVTSAGPQLERALAKTRTSVTRSVGKLGARYQKTLLHRDGELVDAVRRLCMQLQPEGIPQERHHGLPYHAARVGDRALVEQVLAAVSPFDPAVKDLST